jgi:hypothetical protein
MGDQWPDDLFYASPALFSSYRSKGTWKIRSEMDLLQKHIVVETTGAAIPFNTSIYRKSPGQIEHRVEEGQQWTDPNPDDIQPTKMDYGEYVWSHTPDGHVLAPSEKDYEADTFLGMEIEKP